MKFSHEKFPFLCKLTGRCCVQNLVILSPFDIFRLATYLGKSAKDLFQEKIITYTINKSDYWMEPIINSGKDSICPFLLPKNIEEHICEIYEVRPLVCRLYPLKYNPQEDMYFRRDDSESRCHQCFSIENEYLPLQEFVESSNLPTLTKEYNKYRNTIFNLVKNGFNIIDIKNKKDKQKIFFELQKILYETYPNNLENHSEYPWELVSSEIENLITSS
jgi:Fe-S-cluster containining protein